MSGYSKMKLVNNGTKSRSMDLSDLQSSPLETKNNPFEAQHTNFKTQETKPQINTTLQKLHDEEDNKSSNDGRFGMAKLSRNRSVSVTTSAFNMFKIEKQSTNAVKRVFSMRRSSSVSERYCRIHDQAVTVKSPLHDDEDVNSISVKKKKKYSSSSILKACKRLLGI
ncbi:Cytosolic Fe-S cluster assembly factor nar-1 [Heracleum sosnowskyi]|uniref:Cytosolic Fe-S cluster assembly factor nar-1 n=1 Tax=Heracleum sosnowskyi TaxID=360622 RepID=A0AAD8MW35_9APIA|nr:Cytosolic Fe-S cluster assembly factor nar-1 [Heracleum sosnowskyi]KAK1385893.1 Cytosolic Fe-S cluster assembly factor nar-1 [Heracleum sosnowskyi]